VRPADCAAGQMDESVADKKKDESGKTISQLSKCLPNSLDSLRAAAMVDCGLFGPSSYTLCAFGGNAGLLFICCLQHQKLM
jgi:hypothetical protein